jgi:two-component system sensor histidine kinase MprB
VAETRDFTTDVGEEDRSDEIGLLATSFATMLDALEASRLQQHRLIHDAGHEMRTPLTSLRANVAMLERAGDLPAEERAEILAAVRSELIELTELFDEMIDLATDQRDADLAVESVDLAWLIGEVAARWERRSERPIEVDVMPSVVMGDPAMLERAIGNLVSNADKFSPPGEPITIVSDDGMVSVRDCGPGIAADDIGRVFDRFYRSEATRSMPGSGLGLSIVAQIVERHGGEVWARNREGGGADVGFRLQVVAPTGSDS